MKGESSSFPSYYNKNSLTPFFLGQIQDSLLTGMELMSSWVFDMIWVITVYSCSCVGRVDFFCGCADADLVHSDVEMYSQNSG